MTDPVNLKKTRGCWWALAIVIGSFAALAVGTLLWIRSVSDERWADFRTRHAEMLDRMKARTGRRTSLVAPTQPGNAWDDYRPAIASLAAARLTRPAADLDALDALLNDPRKVEYPAGIRAILTASSADLDRIRGGARREAALYPI